MSNDASSDTANPHSGNNDHGRSRLHTTTQLILLAGMVLGLLVFIGGIIWWSLHVPGFAEVTFP